MNKKVTIIGGVAIFVIASYVAASWWTGKSIQKNFDQHLQLLSENINQQFAGLVDINLSAENYQRSLFSTQLHYKIEAENKLIKEDDLTLYHGPFPLISLKSFNFSPALFAFHHSTQILPAIANNNPINATINFEAKYNDQGYTNVAIPALNMPLNTMVLVTSPLKLNFTLKRENNKNIVLKNFKSHADSITLNNNGNEAFTITQLKSTLDAAKQNGNGKFDLTLGAISINSPLMESRFLLKNMALNIDSRADKELANQQIHYNVDQLSMGALNLGSLKLNASLENLPYAFINVFDTEHFDNASLSVNQLLSEFGKNKAAFKLNDVEWKRGNKSSKLNFAIDFAQTPRAVSRFFINNLTFNTALSFPQLTDVLVQQMKKLNTAPENNTVGTHSWNDFGIILVKGFIKEYLSSYNINAIYPFKLEGDKVLIDLNYNAESNKIMLNQSTYDANSVINAFSSLLSEEKAQ